MIGSPELNNSWIKVKMLAATRRSQTFEDAACSFCNCCRSPVDDSTCDNGNIHTVTLLMYCCQEPHMLLLLKFCLVKATISMVAQLSQGLHHAASTQLVGKDVREFKDLCFPIQASFRHGAPYWDVLILRIWSTSSTRFSTLCSSLSFLSLHASQLS